MIGAVRQLDNEYPLLSLTTRIGARRAPLLRAAVHADTDYALPYAFLAHFAEQRHDTTRALHDYREYLAHANHTAAERVWVNDHMARLTKAAARKPD